MLSQQEAKSALAFRYAVDRAVEEARRDPSAGPHGDEMRVLTMGPEGETKWVHDRRWDGLRVAEKALGL